MSNKVLITNEQNVVKIPSGLRILIRRSCNAVLDFEKIWKVPPRSASHSWITTASMSSTSSTVTRTPPPMFSAFPWAKTGNTILMKTTGCKILGDIVISMERAMEPGRTVWPQSCSGRWRNLTVHSMLHLLGYDHEASGLEAVRMREKEEAVLIKLGLPRTVSYTSDEI